MEIIEIGTGYTSIPARIGAATEIVVEALTRAFLNCGQKVALVDLRDENRVPGGLPIREVRVPKCCLRTDVSLGLLHKGKRVAYSVSLARELKQILREAKEPMLLHFHNQYNLFFFLLLTPARLRSRAKIAYTVHSYIWVRPWEEIRRTIRKRYFQEVHCVRKADYVLVLNDKTAEHFVTHLGVCPEKIHRVKNGVEAQVYRPLSAGEKENFKESIGLAGKRYLLQVGSVCDRKNQLGAVKLLTPYLQTHGDAAYVYAGGILEQKYYEELERYARENKIQDQVRYLGEVPPGEALNRYYSAASAMVFPSKQESFGMVILEALAAGTPVLLEEEPMFPLKHGYRVGRICDAAEECLRSGRPDLEAREEVAARYGWDTVAREHLAIFETGQEGMA